MIRLSHCWRKYCPLLFVSLASLLAIGCDSHPPRAPVRGVVTLQGEPVGPGSIMFMPDKSQGTEGKAATGEFGEDGKYELSTYEMGDGAILGHHKVIIRSRAAETAESGVDAEGYVAPEDQKIPPQYGNPARPTLQADVTEGDKAIDFDLEPPARRRRR